MSGHLSATLQGYSPPTASFLEGFEVTNAVPGPAETKCTVPGTATQQEVDNDTGCKCINLTARDAVDHTICGRTYDGATSAS